MIKWIRTRRLSITLSGTEVAVAFGSLLRAILLNQGPRFLLNQGPVLDILGRLLVILGRLLDILGRLLVGRASGAAAVLQVQLLRVWGLGFRVWGFGFGVWGLGLRV